jgi:hypothetical protein
MTKSKKTKTQYQYITDPIILSKYHQYLDKILNDHKTDVVKTFNYNFKNGTSITNRFFHEIFDLENLNKIIITGRYHVSYYGKLENLNDVLLNVTINNKTFKYYKL